MARMIRFGCCSRLLVVGFVFGSLCVARGEVRLPHMLSDHAVLQRQMPVHIWGPLRCNKRPLIANQGAVFVSSKANFLSTVNRILL